MNTLINRLKSKFEEEKSLERVHLHLEDLTQKLVEKYSLLEKITPQLKKEELDLQKIEGGGFKPLFHKILGNKEKQIEKERQEYLTISLKYNATKEEIELMEYEKDILLKKAKGLNQVREEIILLKKQREEEILNGGTQDLRNEYILLLEKYRQALRLATELNEAVVAGEKARKNLFNLSTTLNSIQGWGRWNNNNQANSRYAKIQKQSRLREASRQLALSQRSLDYFAKEMEDLGENNFRFRLDHQELSKFTDLFFDNLITDWIIQQKIKNALYSISAIYDKISRESQALQVELKNTKILQAQLLEEKDGLLIKE